MSRAKQMFNTYIPPATTVNKEQFPAYDTPLEERYLQTLLTNTIGSTYYATKDELLQEAEQVHDAMLAKDPVFAAKAMAYAREYGYMRLQPILGLTKLSKVNPELFAQTFPQVIKIPSDLADFMTILNGVGRGEGGRVIKRSVGKFLNDISEYWAMKYNGRGRGYNLTDAIKTVHPKPKNDTQDALFKYLLGKECDAALLPQITAYETLKRNTENAVQLVTEGRLNWETVTGAIKPTKEVWNALVPQMPVFALLRNLNTFERHDVLDANRQHITEKLTNAEVLRKSKILPFRFLTAFDQVSKPWVKDALRQAVELTFQNLPDIPGKTAIFLDISGSMSGEYLRIGSVFALALFKKTKGNAVFWLFNAQAYDPKPSMYDSILTQAEKIYARGGTDTGICLQLLTTKTERVDNIIIITDEQQNTGSPFYRALKDYRQRINSDAKAFIVDIAPYNGRMTPPTDKNTHYIYGWSENVLQYISYSCQGYGGMVERIRQ